MKSVSNKFHQGAKACAVGIERGGDREEGQKEEDWGEMVRESHLVTDPSVWLRPLYGTLFLLASAASNVFLLLNLILKLIFLN